MFCGEVDEANAATPPDLAPGVGLYLNAGLMAAVLVALVTRGQGPGAVAMAAPPPVSQPIAGGNGLYLMPGQFSPNNWGCYVMDVERQTLVAYEYMPGQKQLRLVAARFVGHDRQIQDYNTTPSPDEMQRHVQLQNQGVRGGLPGDAGSGNRPPIPTPPGERPLDRPPQPGDPDFVPKPGDIANPDNR
jgi:hypothetical protein